MINALNNQRKHQGLCHPWTTPNHGKYAKKKLQTAGESRPWQRWRQPVLTAAHMASYRRGISPLSWAGLQNAPGRRVILLIALNNMYFRDYLSPSCLHLWMVLGLLGDAGVHSVHMEAAKWTHLVICPLSISILRVDIDHLNNDNHSELLTWL